MTAMPAEAPPLDLPRVQGRHRNRVLAARRRDQAVQLVTEGMTYQQVADHMGYASRGTVHRIVHQALRRQEVEDVEVLRAVTLRRLDALLVALSPGIERGNPRAIMTALYVDDRRLRLLGLYTDSKQPKARLGFSRCVRPDTVVVHPDCVASGCPDHYPTPAEPVAVEDASA